MDGRKWIQIVSKWLGIGQKVRNRMTTMGIILLWECGSNTSNVCPHIVLVLDTLATVMSVSINGMDHLLLYYYVMTPYAINGYKSYFMGSGAITRI